MNEPSIRGRDLGRDVGHGPDAGRVTRQAERFARHVASSRVGVAPRRRVFVAGFGAALALSSLVLVVVSRPPPSSEPLRYTIGDQATAGASTGSEWIASDRADVPVRFDDGTRVVIARHSRARVQRVSRAEVSVELTDGTVRAQVQPTRVTTWRFVAAGYAVRVLGTRFTVQYLAAEDRLSVEVDEGEVLVTGPGLDAAGRGVKAGESFASKTQAPAAALAPTPAPAPSPPPESARSTRPRVTWRAHVRDGDLSAAWDAANREGLEQVLEKASAQDLELLADVARATGHVPEARRALMLLGKRFPRSSEAALVPFQLGRLALEVERDDRAAAQHLQRYLKRQPSGQLSEEARGRLMEIYVRLGDMAKAQALARDYLTRHPSGIYEEAARSIESRR